MSTSNRAAIERPLVRDEQNNRPFSTMPAASHTETNKGLNLSLASLIGQEKYVPWSINIFNRTHEYDYRLK